MRTLEQLRQEAEQLSPEAKSKMFRKVVSQKVQNIIEKSVIKALVADNSRISLSLGSKDCRDPDENIADYLRSCGYSDVQVSSDFPGYNESYSWVTYIKFSIPRK